MKVLKGIGIVILILVVLLFVISLFLPSKVNLERSITINAPAWAAFEEVNTVANWSNWDPWTKSDPTAKVEYEGPESGVGAIRKWDGEKVKKGKLEIVESVENQSIKINLYFMESGKANLSFWTFEEGEDGTKVTQGFESEIGFNPVEKYFMAMGMKMMKEKFEAGLKNIKEIAEAKPQKPVVNVEIKEVDAQKFIGVREYLATSDLAKFFEKAYGKIYAFIGAKGIAPVGAPVAFYHSWTEQMDSFDTEAAFPIAVDVNAELEEGLSYVELPAGKMVTALHKGPYDQVGVTWEAVMNYMKENSLEPGGPAYEVYLNDPTTVEASELLTQICFPIQ